MIEAIPYLQEILFLGLTFSVLAISLDLLVGQAGLLSLAQAVFFGIGAYSTGIVTGIHKGFAIAGMVSGVLASILLMSLLTVGAGRLKGEPFVIVTLGLQLLFVSLLANWLDVTQGPLGITGIPPITLGGWTLKSTGEYALVMGLFGCLAWAVAAAFVATPSGLLLRASRDDEMLAIALGRSVLGVRLAAASISATIASLCGSIYAHQAAYIDPNSFTLGESVLVLAIIIIGGSGNIFGPVLGAFMLVAIPEMLRFIGFPDDSAANMRQIFYGASLVGFMIWRPQGLVGKYDFSR